ncbi:MAG TPA: DNA mismatch repair endonuclease MutL [Gammaproteobacteria bacterium]|nr:DNA mismatch repair endonuclease MutL [Gammaproteobacteria bacterium]
MLKERSRIRLLPEALINQIAAGEVIERPASVVKELIENSLDAGCMQIEIDCEQAGLRLIRVTDDGHGIEPEDLPLALCRHATSKLQSFADLSHLNTLGFRGEALPSIGSVAKLAVTSRGMGLEAAWRVRVAGDASVQGPEPAAHNPGTTVEARELFFNAPARRRFVRSERTEFLHIEDRTRTAALGAFHVGFRLVHNRQTILKLRAADTEALQRERLVKLCGAGFMATAHAVEALVEDLRLWGWIAPAEAARNQSDVQHLFINHRPVRDPRLQHAIRLAYQDRLAPGRHPAYVLYLIMNPADLDVNVHPAKTEVRFHDVRRAHDFVLSGLRNALEQGGAGRRVFLPPLPTRATPPVPVVAETRAEYETTDIRSERERPRDLEVVAGRYLLSVSGDDLIISDLWRAFGDLKRLRLQRAAAGGDIAAQPLLFPANVAVEEQHLEWLATYGSRLRRIGFDVEPAGPRALLVRGLPAALRDVEASALMRQFVGTTLDDLQADDALIEMLADMSATATPIKSVARARALLRDLAQEEGADIGRSQRRATVEELLSLLKTSG